MTRNPSTHEDQNNRRKVTASRTERLSLLGMIAWTRMISIYLQRHQRDSFHHIDNVSQERPAY